MLVLADKKAGGSQRKQRLSETLRRKRHSCHKLQRMECRRLEERLFSDESQCLVRGQQYRHTRRSYGKNFTKGNHHPLVFVLNIPKRKCFGAVSNSRALDHFTLLQNDECQKYSEVVR